MFTKRRRKTIFQPPSKIRYRRRCSPRARKLLDKLYVVCKNQIVCQSPLSDWHAFFVWNSTAFAWNSLCLCGTRLLVWNSARLRGTCFIYMELNGFFVELASFAWNSRVYVELIAFCVELASFMWNSSAFSWNFLRLRGTRVMLMLIAVCVELASFK